MNIRDFSQHQKIIYTMAHDRPDKWFFPYDFMGENMGDLFVGYEASARLSELASDHPGMIESERSGKYIRRRLKLQEMDKWLYSLPKDLRYVFHRLGLTGHIVKPKPVEPPKEIDNPVQQSFVDMPAQRRFI